MRQGRGRSAAGRRVRMRGRRRHAACTAGARSSGPARAAARRCSSCRRCRRRATRRRTRWSRRRRRCDGRGRPLSPPRPRPRGPPRSGLDPPRAPRRPEPASRRSRQRAGPRRCEARASGSRGDARRERTAPRPARFREVCAGARPAPASRAPLPARPGSDLSWRLRCRCARCHPDSGAARALGPRGPAPLSSALPEARPRGRRPIPAQASLARAPCRPPPGVRRRDSRPRAWSRPPARRLSDPACHLANRARPQKRLRPSVLSASGRPARVPRAPGSVCAAASERQLLPGPNAWSLACAARPTLAGGPGWAGGGAGRLAAPTQLQPSEPATLV